MNLFDIIGSRKSEDKLDKSLIASDVQVVFDTFKAKLGLKKLDLSSDDYLCIADSINKDLCARIEKDPTSNNASIVYYNSSAFCAVFIYRVASFVVQKYNKSYEASVFAYYLSDYALAGTSIEIHYNSKIGEGFNLDHGHNTVIGETTIIGNNCTILNNVILGSTKIAYNQQNERHPVIGDNVEIASGVKVLGRIEVGNNVKIGPDCVITAAVPDNTTVKLVKEMMQYKNRVDQSVIKAPETPIY